MNIEYATVPGYRPLLLDIHRGAEPAPLVLYLHGGGWRVGSRSSFGPMLADRQPFARLVDAGFTVASADYRLTGEAAFPAQLDDATAALAWLREHADEYGIDADRIVLWGESAGAHLAALLGLRSDGIAAVIDWYGPADLTTFDADQAEAGIEATPAPGSTETRETLLLGGVPGRAAEASPVTYVHDDAPPFLILHGTADRFVPCVQSRRLAKALGDKADLRLIEGADHMWLGAPEIAEQAFAWSVEFATRHCKEIS